jgi:peptidoglycan/xylan/chitin deacetylase (PgdA/CDA1 family)
MRWRRNWREGLRRRVAALRARKMHTVALQPGIVSFTFDDFPHSAYTTGGRILEDAGVRGTYYAALGNFDDPARTAYCPEDLAALLRDGHELGCHTYGHVDCSRTHVREVVADVERNARAVRAALGEHLVNFAYPAGTVAGPVKARLGRTFATCRGNEQGVNRGRVDLAQLRANGLYSNERTLEWAQALINDVSRDGGWLIFYTHDVVEAPSPFGCTPTQLSSVVGAALSSDCRVMPVRSAVGALAFAG